jgi:heme/copper-type cytochrome/quinol oxidase subunit 4
MFAILGAILAAIAAILVIAGVHASNVFCWQTFLCLAVMCIALHLAGFGAAYTPWRRVPPAA